VKTGVTRQIKNYYQTETDKNQKFNKDSSSKEWYKKEILEHSKSSK